MKKMRNQFIRLLNIHGVSGDEANVRKYLQSCLVGVADNMHVDEYGNLLAEKKYGTGDGAVILLSAHMDTVRGVLANRELVEADGFIMSSEGALGADDRAGIAIILEVIRNLNNHTSFNGTLKVAFSREEEIGCVGSRNIDPDWYEDVDLAIVVDRKNTRDIVTGCGRAFCSNAVGNFMEAVADMIDQSDWRCVEGGISDAMTFSDYGTNAINLSAGYYNEHTSSEFVSLEAMKDTATLILQALAVVDTFYHTFGEVPTYNSWVRGYGTKAKKNKYYTSADNLFSDPFYDAYTDEELYLMGYQDELFEDKSVASISDYLDPSYISPDKEIEVYNIGGGDVMLKQEENEMYLSKENITWLSKRVFDKKDKKGGNQHDTTHQKLHDKS